jgi:ribose transport system permease protein
MSMGTEQTDKYPDSTEAVEPSTLRRLLDDVRNSGIYLALGALLIVSAIVQPASVTPTHLLDVTRQASALGIVGIGQTLVILTGGLDLSVGSTITLIDVMAPQMIMNKDERILGTVLLCLAVGLLIGLINGLLVTKLRINPFVATLGMNSVVLGAALVYSRGAPLGSLPPSFRFYGTGFIGPIPASTVVWAVLVVISVIALRRTVLGRYIYATGANRVGARLSGVRTDRVILGCYMASGFFAAVAGLVLAAYIGVGTLTLGQDYMLNSIAVVVVGGTRFEGGKGSITGTAMGALFLMVLFSLAGMINISHPGELAMKGIIIIGAVAMYARSGSK